MEETEKRMEAENQSIGFMKALLLPADFDWMDWDIVRHEVAVSMGVQADQVWIWCPHTTDDVPLDDAFVFFAVDIIKAIENKDSSSMQALLFDGEYLAGRNDNYRQQVQMIKNLGDVEAEKEMLASVWSCVERKVKSMAPSPANKWQAAHLFRFTKQVALVLDLRVCDQTHHIRARISVHKGLYRWTDSTVVDAFPRLSMESRRQSAEMETLTLTVWLREVCQVQQVLTYPQDPHFCDTTVPDTTNRLTSLVDMLTKKFTTDVNKTSETSGKKTNSDDKSPVLLVFFPVDFEVANFSQYFQKVIKTFVCRSSAASLLALVPTTNLHLHTYVSVSALIGGTGGVWNNLTVEILSAFSPADEPVSLLVMKMSPAQLASTGSAAVALPSSLCQPSTSTAASDGEENRPAHKSTPSTTRKQSKASVSDSTVKGRGRKASEDTSVQKETNMAKGSGRKGKLGPLATSTPMPKHKRTSEAKQGYIFEGWSFVLTYIDKPPETKEIERSYLSLVESAEESTDEGGTGTGSTPVPFDKDHLTMQIENGGGTVLRKFPQLQFCSKEGGSLKNLFVVSDTYHRTITYLQALAANIPTVSYRWIIDSCLQNKRLDYKAYVLPAGISMEKHEVLERINVNCLNGCRVLLTSSSSDYLAAWRSVLEIAQCKVVIKFPANATRNHPGVDVMVTDAQCVPSLLKKAKQLEIPTVGSEWIIQCLINNTRMDFKGHPSYSHASGMYTFRAASR